MLPKKTEIKIGKAVAQIYREYFGVWEGGELRVSGQTPFGASSKATKISLQGP